MSSYVVRTFLKYSVIFDEHTRGDSAFLLQEGRVELSKQIYGQKKVLTVLSPVSMFGEMSLLLDDKRRTATAIALDDVRAVELKKQDFDNYIQNSPQIMQSLIDVLVHRLRSSTTKAMQVPGLFQGICRAIEMMARNGVQQFDYMHAIASFKDAFVCSEERVLAILHKLEDVQMLHTETSTDNVKRTRILHSQNFTYEATKRMKARAQGKQLL